MAVAGQPGGYMAYGGKPWDVAVVFAEIARQRAESVGRAEPSYAKDAWGGIHGDDAAVIQAESVDGKRKDGPRRDGTKLCHADAEERQGGN